MKTANLVGRPLPSDHTMATLLALATGKEILLNRETGGMVVVIEPGRGAELEGDALDDLVARGWVKMDDETKIVATTVTGGY